jgi:hypothetical protein
MTPLRLLLAGLGLLLLSLLVVLGLFSGPPTGTPGVTPVQAWCTQVLTLVGSGLVVAAGLVSALAPRPAPAPEPAVDHYA